MTTPRATTVTDIARAIEAWAPPGTAQSYDNVGLQVGRRERTVHKGLIALDCTSAVVEEAGALGADIVVTHHPLVFRPLRSVSDGDPMSGLALALAEKGIALYSAHTNLDAARGGVSFALAERLGLEDVRFLQPLGGEVLHKLVVFVPLSHADVVRAALARAGAGRIGAYEECAFQTFGTGFFRPTDDANPFVGEAGGPAEQVEEVRLEMEVASWRLSAVLNAMREAHPYDEVAYDLVPLKQPYRDAGLGAIGRLPSSESLRGFLSRISERLEQPAPRYAGNDDAAIRSVAVCGGSGSDLIGVALAAGADAFVTGDVKYHAYFDVLDSDGRSRMVLVDAGHYETEAMTEQLLRGFLADRFPSVVWSVATAPTSPVRTFMG